VEAPVDVDDDDVLAVDFYGRALAGRDVGRACGRVHVIAAPRFAPGGAGRCGGAVNMYTYGENVGLEGGFQSLSRATCMHDLQVMGRQPARRKSLVLRQENAQ
jgi:hypothetical protein